MPGHTPGSSVGDAGFDRYTYTYDGLSRMELKTDQEGDTCLYVYDLASRMTGREYRDVSVSALDAQTGLPTQAPTDADAFNYDLASRVLDATKGRYSNTVSYTYDNIGRPATESLPVASGGGNTYDTARTYDDDSRPETLTYPDGSVVTQTYTDRDQGEEVLYTAPGSNTGSRIALMTYDAGRREFRRTMGSNISTEFRYRGSLGNENALRDNQVATIRVGSAPGLNNRQVVVFNYGYDANKNVTRSTRAPQQGSLVARQLSYDRTLDLKDRMTDWDRDNGDNQSWGLSFEGDWQETDGQFAHETPGPGATPFTESRNHSPAHEIESIDFDGAGPQAPVATPHDAKGNLENDARGSVFTYDFDNMLRFAAVGM